MRRPVALLEAAHALEHVTRPADGLAVFAVVDDVDADLRLLAHHVSDRIVQTGVKRCVVVRLQVALRLEELLQLGRPDQAADMRGQDTAGAAWPPFRRCLACRCAFPRGLHRHSSVLPGMLVSRDHASISSRSL
jgi:hypothetical protein